MSDGPFNPAQWAREHDRRDEERFDDVRKDIANVWKVLGVAGTVLLGILGWSLQMQYDSFDKQMAAIQSVQVAVSNSPK